MASPTPPITPPFSAAATLDDIFGDGDSAADLQKLQATHTTSGYRDGISSAKSLYLQDGFDEGYPLGGRLGLQAGWLLGVLQGLKNVFPSDGEVMRAVKEAEGELSFERVFAREWWDDSGLWKWDVEGEEGADGGVTLDEVVDAFPMLKKWRRCALALAEARGLRCRMPGEREEGEEESEIPAAVDGVARKMAETTL